ncbi:hypothetical protein [Ewingella americana]|jgi:hypothetical protein|uniref:Uncharacterized protein n=1 Tax=Ewingella americana TaxID=41202 RepID=A0A502GSY0_9GAMM|nr:hypothetical protein [Ewingella americana]TPG64053.1 hypothetical protein EAH77_04305 [Ewingella americana]
MKLLKNELEYRTWMSEDFLRTQNLSPDQQERELLQHMPKKFPCIASIVKDHGDGQSETVRFLSPEQIAQWSSEMGKTRR